MLVPVGGGIQTPKVIEALLVLTIPIVEDFTAWQQLRDVA